MLRLVPLAGLLASVLSTLAASAQTALDWKFDQPTFLTVSHESKQVVNVMGQKSENAVTVRFVFEVQPAKPNPAPPAGVNVLDLTVLACDDSSVANGAAPEKGTFKGLVGLKFQATLGARNQSVEIAGGDRIATALFANDYKDAAADQKKFMEELVVMILRAHLHDAFMPLPDKAVKGGDTWNGPAEVKIPPLAQLNADRHYTLAAAQPDPAALAIAWTSDMRIKPLPDDKGTLPFKIKEIKLADGAKYDGTAAWDIKAHRPTTVSSSQAYEMALTMLIDGKEVKGSGSGTDLITATFSAENPDPKK